MLCKIQVLPQYENTMKAEIDTASSFTIFCNSENILIKIFWKCKLVFVITYVKKTLDYRLGQ